MIRVHVQVLASVRSRDPHLEVARGRPGQTDRPFNGLPDLDRCKMEVQLPGFHLLDIEKIFDQGGKPIRVWVLAVPAILANFSGGAPSAPEVISPNDPLIDVTGVRSSWLTVARNRDLALLAAWDRTRASSTQRVEPTICDTAMLSRLTVNPVTVASGGPIWACTLLAGRGGDQARQPNTLPDASRSPKLAMSPRPCDLRCRSLMKNGAPSAASMSGVRIFPMTSRGTTLSGVFAAIPSHGPTRDGQKPDVAVVACEGGAGVAVGDRNGVGLIVQQRKRVGRDEPADRRRIREIGPPAEIGPAIGCNDHRNVGLHSLNGGDVFVGPVAVACQDGVAELGPERVVPGQGDEPVLKPAKSADDHLMRAFQRQPVVHFRDPQRQADNRRDQSEGDGNKHIPVVLGKRASSPRSQIRRVAENSVICIPVPGLEIRTLNV